MSDRWENTINVNVSKYLVFTSAPWVHTYEYCSVLMSLDVSANKRIIATIIKYDSEQIYLSFAVWAISFGLNYINFSSIDKAKNYAKMILEKNGWKVLPEYSYLLL